jgi:hypothetical protein
MSRFPISLDDAPPAVTLPEWRRSPCATFDSREPAIRVSREELGARIDAYFVDCYDNGREPRFIDMAAAVGFASLVEMINHARRNPKLMNYISRGLMAVAAGYEDNTAKGLKTGAFLLGRLQGFDTLEPSTQPKDNFFEPTKEVNVNIAGIQRPEAIGSDLTPLEAYQRMIRFKTHAEVTATLGETVDADFVEISSE